MKLFSRFDRSAYHNSNKGVDARKAVVLDDCALMVYGSTLVGAARCVSSTDKTVKIAVVVADKCDIGGEKVERYLKDAIGKAAKWALVPDDRNRNYEVEYLDCEELPLEAKLSFTKK